jgi:DNA polymerase III delta subunit
MKYNYKDFSKNIDKLLNDNKVFFFYGENSYYMLETVNLITKKLKDVVKEIVYPWEVDIDEVVRILTTLGLFSQTTVVVFRWFNAAKKKFVTQIINFLKVYNGQNFLFLFYESKILAKERIEPPLNYFFTNCVVVDFPLLTQQEIINDFLSKVIDFEMTQQAKELLCEYVNNDLWLLMKEIEKLKYFVSNKEVVTEEDVMECCGEYEFSEINQLVDGIINNNIQQNLSVLDNLVSDKKMAEVQILTYLYKFFRKNFIFKNLPLQKVYRILKEIQSVDVKLKTLSVDKKYILKNCVIKLTQIYNERV